MPNLLLEFFSEEIPARMQARAAEDLARMMTEALAQAGLTIAAQHSLSGPRRIAFIAEGVPEQSAASAEERKGPRVGAPEKAVEGFLRAAGLKSLDECQIAKDPKGDYYLARTEKPGRAAAAIIAEAVPAIVRKFPWPKSMRWGAGRIRWVRPLHSILCLFGDKPVEFEVDGIKSGNVTFGHRFLSGEKATEPKTIKISQSSDYPAALLHAKVVVAGEQRAKAILDGAQYAAAEAGLALVEDHGLLTENAGLVEWPVIHTGKFDESFLDVPEEILMTSMKAHQKCFSLRHKKSGKLANRFILVSNLEAADGGKAIVAGNERVIRARLSDAKFFWENDRERPLDGLTELLGQVTFHEKLGTQLERVLQNRASGAGAFGGRGRGRRRCGARGPSRQGRPDVGDGGRIPRAAGHHRPLYRAGAGREARHRGCHRGALQAARAIRCGPLEPGFDRGRACRQARHAGGLLGHRREADRLEGPVCAAPRRTRRHPHHS